APSFPMRLLILCLHVVILNAAFAAPAAAPVNWQSAERAKLLAGVSAIPKLGAPGPVAIWGPLAFPVLAAGESGKAETALVAAAGFGKGRIVLFGHNSYLEPSGGNEASVGALLVNSVKWSTQKQRPRIGTNDSKTAAFLGAQKFDVKKLAGAPEKKNIRDFDVLVLNAQSITGDAEGQAVLDFVKNGGGLVAGMTGWAFVQTSGGKRLNTGHGLNTALLAAGVAFTDASGVGGKEKEFSPRADLPAMMNAQAALDAMMRSQKGGAILAPEEFAQGSSAIQLALSAQPPGRSAFQVAALGALAGGNVAVPTAKKPLTQAKDAAARNRLGIETRVLKMANAADIKAHPAAKEFPGLAPSDAPRVTREVAIHPNIPGWTSTGLWVNAGDPVTVKVPAAVVGKGFAVRIGCHTDTLYHLDKWERAPDITRSVPIESEVTVAANAFGGLVFIEVPDRAKSTADFNVTISGAIEAPLFVLGRDDDAKWNSQIKLRPAPWAEFACDKVILCCPTANARRVTNPTELMEFWKKVVEAQDDISNQTAERKRPERYVCDVQISAGYMHSGYPIMVPVSAADEMITFNKTKAPGWGFYHELGHNHQRGDFTFDGTGEVTNNVIGMYTIYTVLGKDPLTGHAAIAPAKLAEHVNAIRKAGDKFALWKREPFVALTTYIQLVEGFGWDAWRKYLYSFSDPSFGPAPKNDGEKRDQFLVRYSKITGKNLGDFFDFWGIPVSPSAKAEVSKLERWMPKGIN
ncbi:MAG: M60 family metallopeptidase, partial [Chthoniobacteraceae bacterium]